MFARDRRSTRPSRMRRPLRPKTSLSTPPMRMPLRSRAFSARGCASGCAARPARADGGPDSAARQTPRRARNWAVRARTDTPGPTTAAVFDVGLAAAQLPHVRRVQQLRLDAGGGECAPRRVPVDAGPLQGRGLDAVPSQPGVWASRPLASAPKVRVSQVGSPRGAAQRPCGVTRQDVGNRSWPAY